MRSACGLLLLVACFSAASSQKCDPRPGQCPTHELVFPFRSFSSCETDCDCSSKTWKCCATLAGKHCLPPCNPKCTSLKVCTLITQASPWISACLYQFLRNGLDG